jgi:hypothetical protein
MKAHKKKKGMLYLARQPNHIQGLTERHFLEQIPGRRKVNLRRDVLCAKKKKDGKRKGLIY